MHFVFVPCRKRNQCGAGQEKVGFGVGLDDGVFVVGLGVSSDISDAVLGDGVVVGGVDVVGVAVTGAAVDLHCSNGFHGIAAQHSSAVV